MHLFNPGKTFHFFMTLSFLPSLVCRPFRLRLTILGLHFDKVRRLLDLITDSVTQEDLILGYFLLW